MHGPTPAAQGRGCMLWPREAVKVPDGWQHPAKRADAATYGTKKSPYRVKLMRHPVQMRLATLCSPLTFLRSGSIRHCRAGTRCPHHTRLTKWLPQLRIGHRAGRRHEERKQSALTAVHSAEQAIAAKSRGSPQQGAPSSRLTPVNRSRCSIPTATARPGSGVVECCASRIDAACGPWHAKYRNRCALSHPLGCGYDNRPICDAPDSAQQDERNVLIIEADCRKRPCYPMLCGVHHCQLPLPGTRVRRRLHRAKHGFVSRNGARTG